MEQRGAAELRRGGPPPVSDLDWDPGRARELGERALDIWQELLSRLPELPVGRRESHAEVRRAVAIEVPDQPLPVGALMDYLRSVALDHSVYPGHPAFMAYISGAGTVPGAVADLLAAALNQNVGAWLLSPAATEIERLVVRWLAAMVGLPERAGGLMTSGGAVANLVALKVARDQRAGWDVRTGGMAAGPPLVIYQSEEAHWSLDRAADQLGLGMGAVRHVAADERRRMRIDQLRELIALDRREGRRPLVVVATAGTTATGAIDPLDEIADLCAEAGLWLHVDGCYGAAACLVPELRPLLSGIERADSVTIDPHKWLYTPLGGGCVLVRDGELLPASFAAQGSYLYEDKEESGRGIDFGNHGPQFSRSFAALKVWVSLLAHGSSAYRRRIHHDVELARYLLRRAGEHPRLEPLGEVTLSIACFRYVPRDLEAGPGREAHLNLLNQRLLMAVQLDGRAFCSNALLGDRFVLRACITNFRTEAVHIDRLLEVVVELGDRVDAELRRERP